MKILVLSHISELLGGAERSMLDVLDRWAEQYGIEPQIIMREPVRSLGTALDARGWKYYSFDYGFWSDGSPPINTEDVFRNAERNSRAVREIEKIIEEEQPDFVLTNSVVCPWGALAAYFKRVPHVWFVREYGDLDHGRTFEIGRDKTFEDVGNLSCLVVANSKTLEEHLSQYIDKDKLTTLYTPFDLDKISERSRKVIKNPYAHKESLKLITTNNIAPTKGQLEVVEAVGQLCQTGADIELCIMGSGDKAYIDEIKSTASEYGISGRVHLVGSQPDTVPYIALSDVGVMASRKEAFGRATFECLAVGKPVVGANAGATPELVEQGVNGLLYEQGSSKSLAEQIRKYLDDRSLLAAHGEAALETTQSMMAGEHNTTAVYERIAKALEDRSENRQYSRINYQHRWLEYIEVAQRAMDEAHIYTFQRILTLRLKRRLRRPYLYIKGVWARTVGE